MTAMATTLAIECRLNDIARATIPDGSRHVGVDVVNIDEFERQLATVGPRLGARWFTQEELAFCEGAEDRLAVTFAGKEAVSKVLGTGIRGEVRWKYIEIPRRPDGAPFVRLHDGAQRRADELSIKHIAVTLCHEGRLAIAVAAAASGGGDLR
jgi:holo-[acyl-carrier protein] synthase